MQLDAGADRDRSERRARSGPPLRQRQQQATREAIVRAFLELSNDENTIGISVPAVAQQAGVSTRTVYRYFATKDELHTAAANYYNDKVSDRYGADVDATNFSEYLTALWSDFAEVLPAILAEHATPAGRNLRATRLPRSRATVRRALPGADDETVDLIIAVTSSSMFLELVERMGHSPERAVAMVRRVVQLLVPETASEFGGEPTRTGGRT